MHIFDVHLARVPLLVTRAEFVFETHSSCETSSLKLLLVLNLVVLVLNRPKCSGIPMQHWFYFQLRKSDMIVMLSM